jgi:hypothetical protein
MRETALVIMAAGIGSRYGAGIKQLAKVGPSGEIIIDYSIHDALKAGFNKIIFIIRKDIEEEFREVIGKRIEKIAPVDYVYQEMNDLPEGYETPEGRKKPWGTAQAVWAAREVIDCPFAVINADDFYGAGSFKALHEYLTNEMSENEEEYDYCMAGYILGNTLSESGTVARGVCSQNEDGYLRSVTETYKIGRKEGKVTGEDGDGRERELDEKSLVSMNMWGLKPNIIKVLGEGFPKFLDSLKADDIKSEYLLPVVIDGLIQGGLAKVKVLPIEDKWYGVTYQEDRQYVADAIRRMVDDKVYGEKLFG